MSILKHILLTSLLLSSLICFASTYKTYRVIKVIDGDTVYIDFNKDGFHQKEEKVRLNGIDTFEVKPSKFLEYQMKSMNLSQEEALGLGYLGKEFAKKHLLNKYVRVEYTGDKKFCDVGRHLMSVWYDNGKNYEQEVLKAGLGVVYRDSNIADELYQYEDMNKIKKNAQKASSLNLVLLNKKNGKYHKPTCEYGLMSSDVELIKKPFLKYHGAGCCFENSVKNNHKYKIYNGKLKPDVKEGHVELYFLSPLKQKNPENSCKSNACKALLYNIDHSTKSIDFAIYGISEQDKIFEALIQAQKRGVQVRWVTDITEHNENIYTDTYKLMKFITNVKNDYDSAESKNIPDYTYKLAYQGAIMHNKFFIFDNKKVFTGSANISSTCLSGFNSNVAVVIDSKEVAAVYKQEFEQMYSGKFHTDKKEVSNNENIKINNMILSAYFSPANKITTSKIIPIIRKARHYIYVPAFYLTHYFISKELIEAKKRGVDVKIIVDQTSVEGKYVNLSAFKKASIPVKVEDWPGKMHMKSMIIDDNILIIGSMNFTKQGEIKNDENTIIIENAPILTKSYKEHFLKLWDSIKYNPQN